MKELIELAEKKGFESYFMKIISFIPCTDHVITDAGFINALFMCELQKWLREKHKIFIDISTDLSGSVVEFYVDVFTIDSKKMNCEYSGLDYDYEPALKKALIESLKTIKL